MFDENQLVEVKWANKTRKYYEAKGYVFTKYGDCFYVKAKDLSYGASAKVKVICDFCGEPYYAKYLDFNKRADKSKDSCNRCRIHKQWYKTKNKRAKEKFDILKEICFDNDYELITDESEFIDAFTPIEYICKKHGLQKQSLDNIIHGHRCLACSYEERRNNAKHSTEYVKSVIESYNNNKLLNPEDYVNAIEKNLKILCGSCGNTYITSFDAYTAKEKQKIKCFSCACKESKGESRIREFLQHHDIVFEQEKTFKDCKDIHKLPFDFYLPEYNLIIEFDGQHHFHETGRGNYEYTKRHDEIKNQYCKDNDINLLRIPYFDGNYIEEIISKQLNL